MTASDPPPRSKWLPFTEGELSMVFAVVGLAVTAATLLAWSSEAALAVGGGIIFCAYFSALLVRARERNHSFELVQGGGVRGSGHSDLFRHAKRSLLLMHVDDDAPDEALLGLYRTLLDRGVQIRRLIFLRTGEQDWGWVIRFGAHANLRQRAVLPEEANLTRFSFAVVDEACVALSVPGTSAIDGAGYASRFVLRHLLVLRDRAVGRVFARVHSELWAQGHEIADPASLQDPNALTAGNRSTRDSQPRRN